jgi:hypothetical protein
MNLHSRDVGFPQIPDKIIYENETYEIRCKLLEDYFKIYPEKEPKGNIEVDYLRKGYVATYEIINGELFLKDIEVPIGPSINDIQLECGSVNDIELEWGSVMGDFQNDQQCFKLYWYTGFLIIANDNLFYQKNTGYINIAPLDNIILIKILNGNFVEEQRMNYAEYILYMDALIHEFKLTEEYNIFLLDFFKRRNRNIPESLSIWEGIIYNRIWDHIISDYENISRIIY